MKFKFATDEDTQHIFEIAVIFLQRYIGYELDGAISLTNEYYLLNLHDDDFYHHESSYRVAIRIHYFTGLGGNPRDFDRWKEENGFTRNPREAIDYFRENYYRR